MEFSWKDCCWNITKIIIFPLWLFKNMHKILSDLESSKEEEDTFQLQTAIERCNNVESNSQDDETIQLEEAREQIQLNETSSNAGNSKRHTQLM